MMGRKGKDNMNGHKDVCSSQFMTPCLNLQSRSIQEVEVGTIKHLLTVQYDMQSCNKDNDVLAAWDVCIEHIYTFETSLEVKNELLIQGFEFSNKKSLLIVLHDMQDLNKSRDGLTAWQTWVGHMNELRNHLCH